VLRQSPLESPGAAPAWLPRAPWSAAALWAASSFCRACQEEDHDALAALQFLLDASRPLSVTEHGAGRATLRFPGFVASLERSPGPGGSGIVICGSRATLTVRREGWHLSGEEA